jgi:hypothetical protein
VAGDLYVPDGRFGSLADMKAVNCDVRFTPESAYWAVSEQCPLLADFVAEVGDDSCVAPGANVFK